MPPAEVAAATGADVVGAGAGLNAQGFRVEKVAGPAGGAAPVPDHRRRRGALSDYEVVDAVFVDVEDDRTGLLRAGIGRGEIAVLAGEMLPRSALAGPNPAEGPRQ